MKSRLSGMTRRLAASIFIAAASMTSTAHRLDLPVTNVAGKEYYYYDVQQGDNMYAIARQLSVTVDDIIRHNPASRDGLQAGSRLYFPTEEYVQTTDRSHTVAAKESLYGIAHRYGVSIDDILEANPSARDGLREGTTLIIPAPDTPAAADATIRTELQMAGTRVSEPDPGEVHTADATIRSERQMAGTRVSEPDPGEVRAADATIRSEQLMASERGDTLRLVIMAPFMLNEETPSRPAQHVTDFYRGFMLAADSLSATGTPVRITVLDTEGSNERVTQLVGTPAVLGADLIVMPDSEEQMAIIASSCGDRSLLYNPSAVKSEMHRTEQSVIQANIPHAVMYDKAITAFENMYDGYTTLFLSRNGGSTDKEAFTTALRERLTADGRTCLDITYDNTLTDDDLKALVPEVQYVVVPASGRRDEFSKMTPAIKAYRERLDDASHMRVFGYPDWVILRGHNLETLCDIDAVIYSRFYADPADPATIDLNRRFMHTYGTEWIDSAPNQAIAGFDTGMYLIQMLRDNDGDLTDGDTIYRGIQQDIDLADEDSEGYYNNSLYLINYTPSGAVVKTRL